MQRRGSSINMRIYNSSLLIILLIVLTVSGVLFVPSAGRMLVHDDPFSDAEVAVVLSGDVYVRSFAARDLHRQGRVERFLVIPEPPNRFARELEQLGLLEPNRVASAERILLVSGVPAHVVEALPEACANTLDEARKVRAHFEGRLPERMVVVTSSFHTRRACAAFGQAFEDTQVEMLCHASPYSLYDPNGWWRRPKDALRVVTEYEKMLVQSLGFWREEGSESDFRESQMAMSSEE